jgi:DNA topoisomerase-1
MAMLSSMVESKRYECGCGDSSRCYSFVYNTHPYNHPQMGNFNMEPPGLFRGRGEHPRTGKVKVRVQPEQVSLNLSEDACVPRCPEPGHAWQNVQHDPSVTWLCAWNENVQNQNKYVMLAASSSFKGKSDMDKYGKAIQLKSCIDKVRRDYTKKIKNETVSVRPQL